MAENDVDPREVTETKLGSPLRDAAVDPKPSDFLAPINAGQKNPHGPAVVSPEIHASGPAGLRPGVVFVEDVDKQEKREKDFAAARLIDNQPAGDVVANEVNLDDRGPLNLSDPGSAEIGRKADTDDSPTEAEAKVSAKKTSAKKAPAKKS